MADDTLQIFISSPGDVGQERVIAERVIERLQGEFAGRATLEPVRWEHEPLRATEHFQEQITPPAETDIALFILWSRLGTPLPEDKFQKDSGEQYQSGTEWEFENAVEAYQETGTPDLLTYRKTKDPETTLSDEDEVQQRIEQKQALDAFIEHWFKSEQGESFQAAFHTFETPDEFEQRLEEHLRQLVDEKLPARYTEAGEAAPLADVQWHRGSPFRGLRAFEEEHAPVFFGRTAETSEIIRSLETTAEAGAPFVLVTGPSGSGKSSVVKAGVVPTLTRPGVAEGIGLWRQGHFRPSNASDDLLAGLARTILADEALPEIETLGFDARELAELLREAPARAAGPIERALEAAGEQFADETGLPEPPTARLLLTIDQLEEIFTLGDATDEERTAFAEALQALSESGRVWVLATMRSDFFPRCTELPALMELKKGAGHYDLEPPSFAALGYMIRGPVRAAGLQFERDPDRDLGLDEVLHEAAAEAPEALPLLEFTLEELYRRRTEDDVLTFEAYEELGGLTGAIAERAETVFQDQTADVRAAFADVAEALVTIEPGEAESATSRRVRLDEVTETPEQEALTDALVEARLLVTGRTDAGEAVVSVAHEALLREWPRLKDWIERNRAFLQTRARVQERAARWDEEGRPDDLLLPSGQPLAEGRGLLEEREEALGEPLRTYVERSIERAEQRERRRRRLIGGAIAAFVIVVAGFGLFSYQQWTAAAEQRDRVLRSQSRSLAEEAYQQTDRGDAMTGMLLALEALPEDVSDPDRPYVPQAQAALYHAYTHNREQAFFDPHAAPIRGATFGPHGRYLVTVAKDSTTRLYDMQRPSIVGPLGESYPASITEIAFDSSGQRVAIAAGAMARVWSIPSREEVATLSFPDSISAFALSPGGDRILVAMRGEAEDDSVEVSLSERTVRGDRLGDAQLQGSDEFRYGVGYSPSGAYRWVISTNKSTNERRLRTDVYLWKNDLGGRHGNASISGVVMLGYPRFADQERQMVLGGMQPPSSRTPNLHLGIRRLAVQDLSRRESITKREFSLPLLSPSGSKAALLPVSGDTLRLVATASGTTVSRMPVGGSLQSSGRAEFGSDEDRLATVDGSGTVRVWSVPGGEEQAVYNGQITTPIDMSVHPDEQRVAVAGLEGVQVWTTQPAPALDLFERAGRSRKQGFEVPVNGPDGRYVAHIDSADTPHLYGLTPNADDKTLTGHGGDVQDVAFGTDGQKVATGEEDGTLRLWDTETGEERFRLPHSQQIIDVSFAGQGDRVVVLLDSTGLVRKETPRTVVIWDTETQRRLAVVDSVNGGIAPRPISVTPDRSHVLIVRDPHLSASERRGRPKSDSVRVEVWNTETGEREHVFGREKKIENLLRKNTYSSEGSISPDGTYALVNRDSSVAALNLKSGEVRERIYGETATRIAFGSKEKRAALQIGGTPGDPGLRVPIVTLQGAEQLTIRLQEGRRIGKGLRFGPKNRRLAMIVEPSGSNQSHPSVWHVPPGRATPVDTTFLPTHSGTVASPIQFSPDGSYLLTVGEEEVRLFGGERRKPDTYLKEVMDLQHPNPINWVEFTPGGRHVITHTEPGTVRAWPVFDTPQALIDTARARITRPLTDAQREEFNLIQ